MLLAISRPQIPSESNMTSCHCGVTEALIDHAVISIVHVGCLLHSNLWKDKNMDNVMDYFHAMSVKC